MIPRVAALGHGFAGAGLYYLSDKRPETGNTRPTPDEYMLSPKKGQTGARVGFTETRNLPTRDPHKALRCMQWLAAHAHDVRLSAAAAAARALGLSYQDYVRTYNPFRGRRGTKPVYTLSIAWHPTRDKNPTQAQMIAAGDQVLRQLGLSDRQCLMVSHTDTAHPHLHLIVNRVSPLNGKFANMSNDWLKLSAWALDYERRTGQILCFERMINWEQRRGQRDAKALARQSNSQAKGRYIRGKDVPRPDHEWWKKHRHLADDAIRAARTQKQARELSRFHTDMAKVLLTHEAKLARTIAPDITQLTTQLERERARMRQPGIRLLSRRDRLTSVIRRIGDLITGRSFFAKRKVSALIRAISTLEDRMTRSRQAVRTQYAARWTRLERRHEAERKRDEQRIAARQDKGRGEGSITRARTSFNARAHADTGKFFVVRIPRSALLRRFAKAARRRLGERLHNRYALARIAKSLGAKDTGLDSATQSITNSNISAEPQPVTAAVLGSREDQSHQASDREREIAEKLASVKQERTRRKRQRPRGRSRRIE